MKIKNSIIALTAFVLLNACTYTVKGAGEAEKMSYEKKAKKCTFAPLWLAPVDKDFANIDMIAREKGIAEIKYAKQKIYPFVLFTKYCTVVKGR